MVTSKLTKSWQPVLKNCIKLAILGTLAGLGACQTQPPVSQTDPSPESASTETDQMASQTTATETIIIDDLEDKNSGNALGGGWFTFDDQANGGDSQVVPSGKFSPSEGGANGSTTSAKMTGKVTETFPYSYIAIGTTLNKEAQPTDITKYKGIEFWAKGDGKEYQVQLPTPAIKDFNYYNEVFTAQPEWTRYEILFDDLQQNNWGNKTVAVPKADALTQIKSIVWRTYPLGQPRENVELMIDDVKFIK